MDHATLLSTDDHILHSADAGTGQVDGLSGVWKLGASRALRIRAGQSGVLRIAHGRVWATLDQAAGSDVLMTGDHFLSRGEALSLLPGQSMVLEPFGVGHASSAYFSWEPTPCARASLTGTIRPCHFAAQPLADLRRAASLVSHAVGGLARGMAYAALRKADGVLTPVAMIFVACRTRQPVAHTNCKA